MNLSAQQSIVLATRPHLIWLTLDGCEYEDYGTAFVDALETRTSSFGSLTFAGYMRFTDSNLRRLLQVDVFEHLTLPCLDDDGELALLPVAAKVDHLEYE